MHVTVGSCSQNIQHKEMFAEEMMGSSRRAFVLVIQFIFVAALL
jgi:hypothetical protein